MVLGYPLRTALAVAVALAQIGEFSFILAALGLELGVLSREATNALVAAAIVSITLNPLLYRLIDPLESRLRNSRGFAGGWSLSKRHRPCRMPAEMTTRRHPSGDRGYGPVGSTLARLLSSDCSIRSSSK